MGLIINLYKKNFLVRYDFDVAIPYYEAKDFKGLKEKEHTFINRHNNIIHYYEYFYSPLKFKKVILFLPGIGPGHRSYFREINELALKGYKVISLDYEGTGYSKGKYLASINQPTKDVIDLLNELKLKEEIVIVGHSLGAYTALNVINKMSSIKKAIIMSGALNEKSLVKNFVKLSFIASRIQKYERKLSSDLGEINNLKFLKDTSKDILFIHSKDDPMVLYKLIIPKIKKLNNSHLSFISLDNKRHNPNYTVEAVKYMDQSINTYYALVNKKKLKTDEERIAYFQDKEIAKMTEQDPLIINKIINFIG
ncbi:MAG: alpha/beta fold hydrolase [Bacilli bacterium]|nr:alpha/beta fold hydrolase [Bacilli bacterium]